MGSLVVLKLLFSETNAEDGKYVRARELKGK